MTRLLLPALAVLAFSSMVFAQNNPGRITADDLAGQRFVLIDANGKKPVGEREIFFQVDGDMMLSGRVCNNIRGKAALTGEILRMEQAVSTRMMCMDGGLSELENLFLAMMNQGSLAVLSGDRLVLRRGGDVLTFEKRAAPAEEDKQPTSAATAVSRDDLVGRRFMLKRANGEAFAVEGETQPFIEFNSPFIVAGSACNGFRGPGELEDNVLRVENAAATMKLCIDPALAQYERDFHALLRAGARVTLEGNVLTLTGKAGEDGETVTYRYELE